MNMITIDRAVVKQALEALELEMDTRRCKVAIAALRAALAQGQVEPVQEPEGLDWRYTARIGYVVKPYTAPPQTEPQTFDETMRLARAVALAFDDGYKAGVANARDDWK